MTFGEIKIFTHDIGSPPPNNKLDKMDFFKIIKFLSERQC